MLFNTTAELKAYVNIEANMTFASIQPYIEEATELFIKDLLGDLQLTELDSHYNTPPDPVDQTLVDLLPYVQRPLAKYAIYLSVSDVGAALGDAGIQETSAGNSNPAPRWKVEKLEANHLKSGDMHAEKLLQFLEENANGVDTYAEWFNSSSNTIADGTLLPTAREASRFVDINESRRIFLRMKKVIRDIEQKHVKRLICTTQYDTLVASIKAKSTTAEEDALIEQLRPFVAKKALYLTLPYLQVGVTDTGLIMYSSSDGVISKEVASDEKVQLLMRSLRDGDFGYMSDEEAAIQFIHDNISNYPDIESSDCYTQRADPGPKHQYPNSSNTKHFVV